MTEAVATLALKIDTGDAATKIAELATAYSQFKASLSGAPSASAIAGVANDVQDLKANVGAMSAMLDTLYARGRKAFSGVAQSSREGAAGIDLVTQKTKLLADHYEMVSKGAKASSSAIRSQMEVLTATPVGMDKLNAFYKQLETQPQRAVASIVTSLKTQEAAEQASYTRRLKAATDAVGQRVTAEAQYAKMFEGLLVARDKASQDSVVSSVSQLRAQENEERASYDRRLKTALAANAAKAESDAKYEKMFEGLLRAREAAIGASAASLKGQEDKERAANSARLQVALKGIEDRKRAEREYTAWWDTELKKRDSAFAASQLRTAQQKSGMQSLTVERLDRGMLATPQGASTMSQYYQSMGAVQGGGTHLKTLEAAEATRLAASVQQTAQANKSLATSHVQAGAAARKNAVDHIHWKNAANEAHAAARGLSGALGGLWMTYGSIAPLLAGAAIAGSMKSMVKTGMELDYQFTIVKAVSEGAAVSVSDFNKALQGSMFSPIEAAKGLRVLAQAGLTVKQSQEALPQVLKLATMGEVDMAEAALSATAIMHAFGLEVKDMGHIGDVFAKAAAISATSVKEMMGAMRQASQISDMYGVSLEETAGALATLANRGIEGGAAGTAIRNMVTELSAPRTKRAADAMKQMGVEIYNADGTSKSLMENLQQLSDVASRLSQKDKTQWLEDMFGQRGVKAASILLTDMQKMKKTVEELKMSSEGLGFMTEGSIMISQSAEGRWKQMVAAMQLSMGEVYKSIEPELNKVIIAITNLVSSSGFKEWLTGVAQAVGSVTSFIREHATALGYAALAYAGLKVGVPVIMGLATAWKSAAAAQALYSGASFIGPMQSGLAGIAARLGLVATASTATTGAFSGLAGAASTVVGSLSSTAAVGAAAAAALPIAAVVALTGGLAYLVIKEREVVKSLEDVVTASKESNDETTRLNASVADGINDLEASNVNLRARIALLWEGKTAADAAAASNKAYSVTVAEGALQQIKNAQLTLGMELDSRTVEATEQREKAKKSGMKNDFVGGAADRGRAEADELRSRQLKTTLAALREQEIAAQANVEQAKGQAEKAVATAREQKQLSEKITFGEKVAKYNENLAKAKDGVKKYEADLVALRNAPLPSVPGAKEVRAKGIETQESLLARERYRAGQKPLDVRTTTETQINDALAMEDVFGGKYNKPEKPKTGSSGAGVKRDLDLKVELADIGPLENQMKRELDILNSSHSAKLISEEDYRAQQLEIYAKYDPLIEGKYAESLGRLKTLAESAGGDEGKQAEANYKKQLDAQDKYAADKKLRLIRSSHEEQGIIKASFESTNKFLAEQRAKLEQMASDLALEKQKIGMSAVEVAGADAARGVKVEFNKRIADKEEEIKNLKAALDLAAARKGSEIGSNYDNNATLKAYREELTLLTFAQEANAASASAAAIENARFMRTFDTGVRKGLRSYLDEVDNVAALSENIITKSFKGMEDALTDFVSTGKLDFKSLVNSFIADMARMTIRQNITGPLAKWMSGLGGGSSGGGGGSVWDTEAPSSSGSSASGLFGMLSNVGSWFGFAKGGVFDSPSLSAYSNQILNSPTLFKFAQGSMGVAGEAGPEAIIPLARDGNGKLGIKSSGSNQGPTIHVHINGSSSAPDVRRAAGQGAREALAAFASAQRYS